MSADFDPYHRWLGIPSAERPANHYRLLGIPVFESDVEVIRDAAAQRMAHVRTYQLGPHSAISQTILNELAAAKACLSDPEKKARYDAELRKNLEPLGTDAIESDVFSSPGDAIRTSAPAASRRVAKSKPSVAWIGIFAASGAAVVFIALWAVMSGGKASDESRSPAQTAAPMETKGLPIPRTVLEHGGRTDTVPPLAVAPFSAEEAQKHQARWAEYLKVPVEQTNSIGMKFVLIPPGEFTMGSPESDADAKETERPQHRVRITKPFCLGAHEVTVVQFGRFVEETGYRTDMEKRGLTTTWRNAIPDQTNDHPVVAVTWNDAVAFDEWLSKKEGQPCRLPTEAEWEFACRAGGETRYWFGDDPKDLLQYDWVAENCEGRPHPVGQKKSNAWALFDMHGNVLEWCSDWWHLYSTASSDDPAGPNTGTFRILRGDCWGSKSTLVGSARRNAGGCATTGNNVGFRVARTVGADSRAQ